MRLFVAVAPGERFVQALTPQLDPWRSLPDLAWVRPDNWHVTLQFLGEWPSERQQDLRDALAAVSVEGPIELVAGGWDAFPDRRAPRVLFLQMNSGGALAKLAARIRENVWRVWPDGPQDRRAFRAHLTLARVGRRKVQRDFKALWKSDLSALPPIAAGGFSLFASVPGRDGVRYRELAFYRLRKKGE